MSISGMDAPKAEAERNRLGIPRHSIIKDGLASVALNEKERTGQTKDLGESCYSLQLTLNVRNISPFGLGR
jgi:hypothetical protein